MRAARYRAIGGPEHLEVVTDHPRPEPREGEVLLRVRASSVNPVDWKRVGGQVFPFNVLRPKVPHVPGYDVAGVVEVAAGRWSVGDKLFVRLPGMDGGSTAEYATFPASFAARMPEGLSFEDAAAIPLAGMTALQGLRQAGLPKSGADGKRVLVLGASGGVGHLGVQIARASGAHVTGVCSARNADLVRSLGADVVLDYAADVPLDRDGPYDVVLDCVGGRSAAPYLRMLRPGGAYASTFPDGAIFARQMVGALGLGPRVYGVMLRANGVDLGELAALWEAKKLRPHVDKVYALDEVAEAHRASISGRARGKLVIRVADA